MMDGSGLRRAEDGWGGWRVQGEFCRLRLGFPRHHWLTNLCSVPLGAIKSFFLPLSCSLALEPHETGVHHPRTWKYSLLVSNL